MAGGNGRMQTAGPSTIWSANKKWGLIRHVDSRRLFIHERGEAIDAEGNNDQRENCSGPLSRQESGCPDECGKDANCSVDKLEDL